jgi:thiamine biosynthesis protein ThiI
MNVDVILLRFGEISIKGRNRGRFETAVLRHVEDVLRGFPRVRVVMEAGRAYVELNGEPYEPIAAKLADVFGIVSFSPVIKTATELEAIRQAALDMFRLEPNPPRTFKVVTRRAWKGFAHDSQQMNHLVGGHILKHNPGLKVDVHHPDVTLYVEIRQDASFVYSSIVPGAGGFPIGSNGRAMLMLSGGIDSPVAGWLAMRRGLELEAVHFHSYPFTSEKAQQKVIDLTNRLSEYTRSIQLHMVPFTEIQTKLVEAGHDNLLITLMRRAMFRITARLAEKRDALAIVTGDSLGQVASQTLPSLNVINKVVDIPVLRPLITMDKMEIIRLAESIGTYPISILPYEDCCTLFVPKNPSTNPNLHIIERVEQGFGDQYERWIEDAVNRTERMTLPSNRKAEVQHLF